MISSLKAQKLIRQGCQGYLVHLSTASTNDKGPSIKEVEVVREFSEVFPEELAGLPPQREVEFSISLMPGAAPISISSYRMAPVEMLELKKQI